jgi:uncharacterized membrane protein YjjP (DUF1212 family)
MADNIHSQALEFCAEAARLLLEHNEAASAIRQAIEGSAARLDLGECSLVLSYDGATISLGGEGPVIAPVRELRINAAIQARVHAILRAVRCGELELVDALAQLKRVRTEAPRHPKWLVALSLGGAAASLALLLGADAGASLAAAAATGIGFAARQELGRRGVSILAPPFVAALIGAVIGGLAIRRGWTATPGLALIVPSLILVPGPHIINGLLDLVDNHMALGLFRLALACSLLTAAMLGIVVGMELTLPAVPDSESRFRGELTIASDMVLAGIVTCGFALAYNSAWPHVCLAVLGGVLGHGLRYVALQGGGKLDAATFLGGLAVGIVSACIARFTKVPVAVIAFAGAVTMMPGVQMYRALVGVLRLSRLEDGGESPAATEVLGYALQAGVVASALALGLVVGVRIVSVVAGYLDNGKSTDF